MLSDLLDDATTQNAAATALLDGDQHITFGALSERVVALADWFAARGIGPGVPIALHLGNSIALVEALFAAARLGADIVLLHPAWTGRYLDHALAESGARALLTQDRALLTRDRALPSSGTARVLTPPETLPPAIGPSAPQACRVLLFTSGSTGMPRLVVHRGASLAACARGVASTLGLTPRDCTLGLLPLAFHYGLTQVTGAFAAGAACAIHRAPLPAAALDTAARHRCTVIAAVPGMWATLLAVQRAAPRDLSSLRCVTNAGGRPGRALLDALPQLLPDVDIVLFYGQTEVLRSSWLPPGRFVDKAGAIGMAFPGVHIAVVDGSGEPVAQGEEGELVHGGAFLPVSVGGRTPAPCPALGGRPAWRTGDRVRQDPDGVLWFLGRYDDLIKTGGYRIGPGEVEDALVGAPGVAEAVAAGVADPDRGQTLLIAVRKNAGSSPDPAAIRRWCRRHLPGYMVPARVFIWTGPWPRTPSGKVDRRAVVRAILETRTRT